MTVQFTSCFAVRELDLDVVLGADVLDLLPAVAEQSAVVLSRDVRLDGHLRFLQSKNFKFGHN